MDSITQEDVIRILQIVEESNTDELQLEMGDLKLVLKKSSVQTFSEAQLPTIEAEAIRSTPIAKPAKVEEIQTTKAPISQDKEKEGLIPIKAPMLGTFYQSPKPGEPPFVKVGQKIAAEDTVCIIEVMKLFSTVKAGINGRIQKICAEDGQMVEYNQDLFWVEEITGQDNSKKIKT